MSPVLETVPRSRATGRTAQVYEAIARDFLLVPPLTLHSPSPELLAGVWCVFREVVLCGAAPRAWKEAIAAAVARVNRCPFCVDAHTLFLHGLGAHDTARRLARDPLPAGSAASGADGSGRHGLDGVVAWASAVRTPGAPVLWSPPFPQELAPELVGTAVGFQYVTTLATVFLDSTPIPRGFRWMKETVRRVGGAVVSRRLDRRLEPGRSLALLPGAPLPPDLGWAAPAPAVAGAYARLAAAVDRAGERTLAPEARRALAERLGRWDGGAPPLGRAWLDPEEGAGPRLALLAALAPERLTPADLAAARAAGAGDRDLLELVAWGAFTAARRVGTWTWGFG